MHHFLFFAKDDKNRKRKSKGGGGRHACVRRGFRRWKMARATTSTLALTSSAAPSTSYATFSATSSATSRGDGGDRIEDEHRSEVGGRCGGGGSTAAPPPPPHLFTATLLGLVGACRGTSPLPSAGLTQGPSGRPRWCRRRRRRRRRRQLPLPPSRARSQGEMHLVFRGLGVVLLN